jgi:hypothetical protein
MIARASMLLAFVASVLAVGVSPASGAISDEVNAGRAVAAHVDAGTATCKNISDTDFEHLGEYVMDRMVGSRSVQQAMNARMEAMIGAENADRMHQALGRRYAGCATLTSGAGARMMGGGMMGRASTSAGGWGAMMGSDLSWMRDGRWQHMSRSDWERSAGYVMGPGITIGGNIGWSTGGVLAAVLGALLLGALAVFAAMRWRRRPGRPTTA